MKCYRLIPFLFLALLGSAVPAVGEELSDEQQARAQALLQEMAAAHEVWEAEEAQLDANLRAARSQVQAAEVALLEARAWLERGFAAEAGQAFLEAGIILGEIDDELRPRLQPRLRQAEAVRLTLARKLLADAYLSPAAPADGDALEEGAHEPAAEVHSEAASDDPEAREVDGDADPAAPVPAAMADEEE